MSRSGTDVTFDDLLRRFPKTRIPLPEAHRQRYVQDYQENRSGQSGVSSLVAKLEGWMHGKVASSGKGDRVLELGAGNLNHIKHESKIGTYDAVEPFAELWTGRPELKSIRKMYSDISEIPEGSRY